MKNTKITKTKLISLLVSICVAVIACASTSLAYFTDVKEYESVYTTGNVYIELTEGEVKKDDKGNWVLDDSKPRLKAEDIEENTIHSYGRLFPGLSIHKDPTVKNVGTEDAWLAMKIIISDGVGDIHNVFGYYESPLIDIELFLTGGLLDKPVSVDDWNGLEDVCIATDGSFVMAQIVNNGNYEFYFFMLNKTQPGFEVTLFETLKMHPLLTNNEMKEFVQFKIDVQAFAVQAFGFSSCYDAMKAAFTTHFNGL